MTDKKYNEMPLLRWLLLCEGGVQVEGCNDADLKPAFEKNRKKMFSNDPSDKGGATMCGVTYKTFVRATKDDDYDHFYKMSYERWAGIVERLYWVPLQCQAYDSLPLALVVADFAFNSGERTAVKMLQNALNAVNFAHGLAWGKTLIVDGVMGKKTLGMVQAMPRNIKLVLAGLLTAYRVEFLKKCCNAGTIAQKFEAGLINRARGVALEMTHYL